ncbi:hypothetical protein AVEN_215283-1 [Araneus ventricosus]|uniref:Endonuclease/exonuclease/phosphatase domain-containing protein n=1 Tax=Araneus ventricosus TaxID=182803 RepID=A0A4Y2QTE4_ARAVE|nr:hypothetical protein AVEN_215283-1 [Araneus ventricosus]
MEAQHLKKNTLHSNASSQMRNQFNSKMSQIDDIATCTWNANEVIGKISDLRKFINIRKPEIMLIQETHRIGTDKIYIPNYTFYSTPSRTGRRMRV